ncbi:MAG: amidohydrolase family protein [Acidobacteria bacterium]|nr:amidohydrolase family protein [Acidobacteriota bacterium]
MSKQALASVAMVFFCVAGGWAQNVDVASKLGYPQMIVYNGKIVTMDDKSFASQVGTIVQAMAIRDGKILATGTTTEVRALAGPPTKQIDLKGRTVLPSFILSHEHPVSDWAYTEPFAFRHVFPNDDVIISRWLPNLPPKEQLAMFEPTMKEAVAKAKPGQWIRVIPNWGPDYEWAKEMPLVWGPAITKTYLDQLAPNNPVCISDGFTSACTTNAKGVEIYGSVHSDLDYLGTGRRGLAPSEERNRRLTESGNFDRTFQGSAIFKGKLSLLADLLKAEMELWARYGITTFGSGTYGHANMQALHLLDQRGDMPARHAWAYEGPAWDIETLRVFAGTVGHGSDYLWLIGARSVPGSGCMTVPERPEWQEIKAEYGGGGEGGGATCTFTPGTRSREILENTAESGFRIANSHTGGDKDIDYYMDAIEAGSKKAGLTIEQIRAKRHAFDHGSGAPRPAQIPRIKNLGMMVSMINTILWETHRGASVTAKQYGIEYTDWVVPRKSVNDAEIMNTFEIDRPLPHKVFFFITKGMNRYNDRDQRVYGPNQRTDRIVQLKALTRWGSYYMLRENLMGTLEPGKFADFIVLDKDFLTIPEAEIPKIQVLMTIVGGKPVHLGADLAREIGMAPVGPSTWTEPIPPGWEPKPY